MAFGMNFFSGISGAVSDIFGGEDKSGGMHLQAAGMRINAEGMRLTASGDRTEAQNYDLATTLAKQNDEFEKQSVAIKQTQAQRQIYLGIGATQADVAGSGFAASGSALDLMREGAQQGALTKQVIGEQGLITEAGYEEQANAYTNLAGAARYAATVEDRMADETDNLAGETDSLASRTESHGFLSGAIKGIAGVASLFI